MKGHLTLRLVLGLFLLVLIGSGCAKKPVSQTAAPAPRDEAPVVSQVPSESIRGIQEQGISDTAAGDGQMEVSVPGLQRIFFDFNQFTLTPQSRDILAGNAAYLKAHPGTSVRIEGHCDERGSDEYNLALGERRARAAQEYLISLGIAANRLQIISYGEEMPLDPGHTEAAWAKNRRAEFKALQ